MAASASRVLAKATVVCLIGSVATIAIRAVDSRQDPAEASPLPLSADAPVAAASAFCAPVLAQQAWLSDIDDDGDLELVVSDGSRLSVLQPFVDRFALPEPCPDPRPAGPRSDAG